LSEEGHSASLTNHKLILKQRRSIETGQLWYHRYG